MKIQKVSIFRDVIPTPKAVIFIVTMVRTYSLTNAVLMHKNTAIIREVTGPAIGWKQGLHV